MKCLLAWHFRCYWIYVEIKMFCSQYWWILFREKSWPEDQVNGKLIVCVQYDFWILLSTWLKVLLDAWSTVCALCLCITYTCSCLLLWICSWASYSIVHVIMWMAIWIILAYFTRGRFFFFFFHFQKKSEN